MRQTMPVGSTTRYPVLELARRQETLASLVSREDLLPPGKVRLVAGGDVTFLPSRGARAWGLACFAFFRLPELELVSLSFAEGEVRFPYLPGYLSFRELPLLLEAARRAPLRAEVYLLDAQGIAHPRGLGLASHFGVVMGVPSVGCAKSRLFGHPERLPAPGEAVSLLHPEGGVIGAVIRPGGGKRCLYVSPGHRVSVEGSLGLVRRLLRFSLPEPTRVAHLLLRERVKSGAFLPLKRDLS